MKAHQSETFDCAGKKNKWNSESICSMWQILTVRLFSDLIFEIFQARNFSCWTFLEWWRDFYQTKLEYVIVHYSRLQELLLVKSQVVFVLKKLHLTSSLIPRALVQKRLLRTVVLSDIRSVLSYLYTCAYCIMLQSNSRKFCVVTWVVWCVQIKLWFKVKFTVVHC